MARSAAWQQAEAELRSEQAAKAAPGVATAGATAATAMAANSACAALP
eukprot:CAMPEP_0170483862 /NCGR_PEP_ID=MMETSP0208-20121228/3462_1 /TAXON_ID=197538 /ORGANISM="Strombidium inclinatum, Strain S3" /LENGTH=47 /DNA_ID= /DNA_START= /DNA_END= /DNA_ORIENTATION=